MGRFSYEYDNKQLFMQRLSKLNLSKSTIKGYSTLVLFKGVNGDVARKKWDEVMGIAYPQFYQKRNRYDFSYAESEKVIPFYVLESATDVTPSQEFHGQDYVEEAIEEERKDQVVFLLDMMKDVMSSSKIDSSSKLAVVEIFVKKLETIEWAK